MADALRIRTDPADQPWVNVNDLTAWLRRMAVDVRRERLDRQAERIAAGALDSFADRLEAEVSAALTAGGVG